MSADHHRVALRKWGASGFAATVIFLFVQIPLSGGLAYRVRFRHIAVAQRLRIGCGCSSVVEHNLAKVGVEGSNPFARSIFVEIIR